MDLPFDTLKERYLTLPAELRDTISSAEAAETLYVIGKENLLRIDEMDALSKQTALVLLGITHPNDFVARLQTALPLSRDKAPAIAAAVSEQIFAPIHDSIVSIHKKDASEQATVSAPAAASTAPMTESVPRTLGTDMTRAKMNGTFRLPPDMVSVKASPSTATLRALPKLSPVAPVRDGKYATVDPYREPTT